MNSLVFLLLSGVQKSGQTDKAAADASGLKWEGLAILAAAVIVLSLVYWFVRRWRTAPARQMLDCPAHLLRELCLKHGIGRSDQRLLAKLAREQSLAHPGMLFVDARLWDPSRLHSLAGRNGEQLERLRERIFKAGR